MMIRAALLSGITWTIACAPAQGSYQFLSPEPAETLVEVQSVWGPVEGLAPEPIFVAASPPMIDDPVRDVVYTDPGELPRMHAGTMPLPLRHTAVRAHLRGTVAEVVVKQRFVNGGELALEAIYTFPLPENSAVTDMRMVIGERVITSEIHERGEARRVYEDARESGHRAALLEQERPNVFTQSIANIAAGEAIDVEIRYLQTLSYDAGEYEFVFPTVVGPRYAPAGRVADAARINPPVLGRGQRSGHDLSIEVTAETGSAITGWAAPAHEVQATAVGSQLQVKLARRGEIANRDFVLRYRSAAAQPAARLFLGPPGKTGNYFMLLAEPPRVDVDALVGSRELVFVVDVSG
ncbi:MAG TPA: VIT domain-containing protein, partial [Nannocystis sp.]